MHDQQALGVDQEGLDQGNQGFDRDDQHLDLEQHGLPPPLPLFSNWKFQVFMSAWLRCIFNGIYNVIDVEWMNLYLFLINVLGLAPAFAVDQFGWLVYQTVL